MEVNWLTAFREFGFLAVTLMLLLKLVPAINSLTIAITRMEVIIDGCSHRTAVPSDQGQR